MRRLAPLLLLAPPLAAQEPARAVIRDSAGIVIVENPARATWPVTHRLAARPVYAVGGLEDDPFNEFDHNQGFLRGVRLGDGGLAVIDEHRVHIFDAQGRRVRVMGVKGRGPREFLYLTSICRTRGDTVVVGDSHNRRLTVLHPSGAFVRTIRQDERGSLPNEACFDDGTIMLTAQRFQPKGVRIPWTISFARLDGKPVGGRITRSGVPFDEIIMFIASSAAGGKHVHFGSGERSEIEVWDREGRLVRLIRTADPMREITRAEREAGSRSGYPLGVSPAEVKAHQQEVFDRSTATAWPAYDRFMVDGTGRLWVQDYRRPPERRAALRWTSFDAEGRISGRLEIPAPPDGDRPWQVIAFGDGDVLIRTRDADGGAWLGVYRIEPVAR
jgi:hypothetical protein